MKSNKDAKPKDLFLHVTNKEFQQFVNEWPPFKGAGISVKSISKDFRSIVVELKQEEVNENINGTHFGGSIYSMTDPFYGLMIARNLGNDYIVWDKEATIKFKKPGIGIITAEFNISAKRIAEIKNHADNNHKVEEIFKVKVKNEQGETIAEVDKLVYIRRKNRPTIK